MQNILDDIAIFPLTSVLFPEGGRFSLRIFEPRYIAMVTDCLKHEKPFGVCLIESGKEIGKAALSYQVGTLAKIIDWGQTNKGVLTVEALGTQRFKILASEVQSDQLTVARLELFEDEANTPIPEHLSHLATMLEGYLKHAGQFQRGDEKRLLDAAWVSYRLAEGLSMDSVLQQRLLEMHDPLERLNLLLGFYAQK